MTYRPLLAAALAVLSLAAPPAVASIPADGSVQAGPVLAGDGLVYAVRTDEGEVGPGVEVRRMPTSGGSLPTNGGSPQVLARHFPRTAEAHAVASDLAGSFEGFAVAVSTTGQLDESGLRAFGATFGSPARELGSCPSGAGVEVLAAFAFYGCDRLGRAELGGGDPGRPIPASRSRSPRAAGALVAFIEGDDRARSIVVYDINTVRLKRRHRIARIAGRLEDFDVRGDGSLALAYSGRRHDGSWVGTLSARGRRLTRLSVRPAPRLAVRYAGTRVAVLRGDRDIVLAQRGRRTQTVARGVAGDDHAAFDFDAQRLSWRTGSGDRTRLHLKRVG